MPEPDIEDLIKCDKDTKECLLDHDEKYHHFSKEDVKVIQKELLDWYDENRRKLPWRGDPPPYLSTSSHTKSNKIQLNKLSDYFKQEKESGAPSFVKEESLERNKERRKVLPYETWVSEIMLQQTRVDTVVDYFLRWTEKFPTIQSLAEANEEV
jgi:A/G-specific adenine glycosylase